MTRPWLTLPPLLADYARVARLLYLSTADLRSMHTPPPAEVRCWRTTPEGRRWQAEVERIVNQRPGGDETRRTGPEMAPESRQPHRGRSGVSGQPRGSEGTTAGRTAG